jgi:hypothetical protein
VQRLRVEVVVEVEVEEVQSYRSIRVSWQRTITGYVVRRPIRGGVFDRPESIVEVQVNDQTGP